MTGGEVARFGPSTVFNAAVSASGIALGATSVVVMVIRFESPHPLYYLCALLVMVMSRFPMVLGKTSGGIEIGFDSCVMIFLALSIDPVEAYVIWSLGVVLAQLAADKRRWVKIFNTGLGMLAGGCAFTIIGATRGPSQAIDAPRVLLAVILGAAGYFLMDFVLSAIAVSLHEGTSVRKELGSPGTVTALAVFLAIDSIGFRAAVDVGHQPWWSASLVAVPIATILVAARARSRGVEHARRLDVMFKTALSVQAMRGTPSVLKALRDSARELLQDQRVELRAHGPGADEVGAPVRSSAEAVWVIGPARPRARSTARDDQQALEALVAVVDEGLSRLLVTDEMAFMTHHDPLTGLANRTMFIDRVEHALKRRQRAGLLAVLFCDLDGFKQINDRHGHAAGDEVLLEVATRMSHSVRAEDTVARLGGDEFVVLLESVADDDALDFACQRLLEALRDGTTVAGQEVSVTTTIGVAIFTGSESAETLLSNADMAMYNAKSRGKDRYEVFRPSLGDERAARLDLIEGLRRAVDKRELQVYYEPVVDLITRRILGVEALARWQRNGVWVPPEAFIPIAEQTGQIVRLGDLILEQVTADAPRLRAAAGQQISIAINISGQQLMTNGFAVDICRARAEMGDIRLILDVTERDFVSDDPSTLAVMAALAAEGIRFAIDDFGIGFSSIGYLRRLPVDIIKIDRSFIAEIDREHTACLLVQSITSMVAGLGLVAVAEGVERIAQVEHLTEHSGVTIAQGSLFGLPRRCEEIMAELELGPSKALV